MSTLLTQYNALPRSMKWVMWALVVLVAYFGVVEPVLDMTNSAASRADTLAKGLEREVALTSPDSDQGRILASGRKSFGEPLLPEDPRNRPEALHTAVDAILKKYNIDKATTNERKIRIAGDEATALLGALASSGSAERVILDISFEAAPETVTAILSELEQTKEVAAISRVEIRRQDAGREKSSSSSSARIVKATISPEAWILQTGSNSGGSTR